tara:strand:- start:731 stop:1582 length:852 start_codon:yes stop_codon:yes gene_type:complete
MFDFFKNLFSRTSKKRVRDQLQDLLSLANEEGEPSLNREERFLMNNILEMDQLTVDELCVPRADIKAVSRTISYENLVTLVSKSPHTRLPVYGNDLDDIRGIVHIKDLYAICSSKAPYSLKKITKRCLFVSPSRPVLHLLMQMRVTKTPVALVVDEQGGVDGLITYGDIVEALVGDMGDDDFKEEPFLVKKRDGTYEADARLEIDEFLQEFDLTLTEEEEDDEIETLGGLIFSLVGRVPDRKEIIPHPQGLEFEILEANPRRIVRVGIRRFNIEAPSEVSETR